jgi:hypothetical protein
MQIAVRLSSRNGKAVTRSAGPNPNANFGVARVKYSLFGNSYIGAMAIDKRSGSPTDSTTDTFPLSPKKNSRKITLDSA